jgi:hypothetical protein
VVCAWLDPQDVATRSYDGRHPEPLPIFDVMLRLEAVVVNIRRPQPPPLARVFTEELLLFARADAAQAVRDGVNT